MLMVTMIVTYFTVHSIHLSARERDVGIFFFVLVASVANLSFAYYIVRGSYMLRDVMPRKKIEYFLTAVSIVAVVTAVFKIDISFFKEIDTTKSKSLKDGVIAWDIVKWELYLYKANLAFWFARYLFIMTRKKKPSL